MRDDLDRMTPRLSRYARALTCGDASASEVSDMLVRTALMRVAGARRSGAAIELPVRLYATVTQLHREFAAGKREEVVAGAATRAATGGGGPAEATPRPAHGLAAALLALSLEEREALLLTALERFDHATAARILRISRPVLFERLTRARTRLGQLLGAAAPAPASAAPRVPYLRLVVG